MSDESDRAAGDPVANHLVESPAAADGPAPSSLSRGALLRRLIVFQIKLALDGLRDLLLSPLSIITVAAGLLFGGNRPDRLFRRLMSFGRRTDIWIDLFDLYRPEPWPQAGPHAPPASTTAAAAATANATARPSAPAQASACRPAVPDAAQTSAESVIDSVERILREEYARGGSREAIEARLARLRDAARGALQGSPRDARGDRNEP